MSPLPLGILAASGAAEAPALELVQTISLTGNSSSITFSNIDTLTQYKHLQIRISANGSETNDNGNKPCYIVFNNDTTGSTYWQHRLTANGSSVSSEGFTATDPGMLAFLVPTQSATGNPSIAHGVAIIDILDFSSTSKRKVFRSFNGSVPVSTGESRQIQLSSGNWLTTAISSINLRRLSGFSFAANSRFSLYGIRG